MFVGRTHIQQYATFQTVKNLSGVNIYWDLQEKEQQELLNLINTDHET